MMDVVYTIGNFGKHGDGFELRYSLRSLEEQDWVRNIYILGNCPDFLKNVKHIPCPDHYRKSKDANIINKVLMACSYDVSDDFIVNSDDHYILKKIDREELGPWLENSNVKEQALKKRFSSTWALRLIETENWCKKNGYHGGIFQSHIPYVVNKRRYQRIMCSVPWAQDNGLLTHVYQMIECPEAETEPEGFTVRIHEQLTNIKTVDSMLKKATFLNHNDNGFSNALKDWLIQRFPKKSKWEK